jgi:hypothetical protein
VILYFCFTSLSIYSQTSNSSELNKGKDLIPIFPCEIEITLSDGKATYQSSTQGNSLPHYAVNGIENNELQFSSTEFEMNPFWGVDLGAICNINKIKISQKSDVELSDYYILISEKPFASQSLSELLLSNDLSNHHVVANYPSGSYFEFPSPLKGQYVRIQKNGYGQLVLKEVGIGGNGIEICDNGIDDDCDKLIDCEDSDCAPNIYNVHIINEPSCNICLDGSIGVQVFSNNINNLRLSIDNGLTFIQPTSSYHIFEGLGIGSLSVIAKNIETKCISNWNGLINLTAPIGNPNECCNNGDFENGDFSGWTGGYGYLSTDLTTQAISVTWASTTAINNAANNPSTNTTVLGATHQVVGTNYTDPIIPFLPISNGGSGSYVVKLGNETAGLGYTRLTYCFDVSECNKMFSFNYLPVLQEPSKEPPTKPHSDKAKPYFEYIITDVTNSSEIVKNVKIISDITNPFFHVFDLKKEDGTEDLNDVLYTFWNCELIDLSSRIGHAMCIEFNAADCSQTDHFGYAYIDGLCNSPESMKPHPEISGLQNKYCQNQEIKIDGSKSYNFNQFGWSICELNGIQEINCYSEPLQADASIGIIDLKEKYLSGGQNLSCGKTYRVKLTLDNECSEPVTVSQDFIYLCETGVTIDYSDIINCKGELADITILGNINNCTNCSIKWTPSQYLSSSTIANPIIQGSSNVLAVKQIYHIRAESGNGCVAEDDVNIFNLHNQKFEAFVDENSFCDTYLKASFESPIELPIGVVSIKFKNTDTGDVINGQLNETAQLSKIWSTSLPIKKNSSFIAGHWVAIFEFSTNNQTNCVPVIKELGYIGSSNLYFGGFRICMPEAFTPDGNGTNDNFGLVVFHAGLDPDPDYSTEYGHNASWGRLQIFSRWNMNKVLDITASGSPTLPFKTSDLTWNGKINNTGQDAPQEVYIFILDVENCDYPRRETNCDDKNCCSGVPESKWCTCSRFTGDITLFR